MAKKKEKKDAHAIESVENCDFKARVEELEVANYDFKNIDIKSMIRVVRGMQVLLDSDLAGLYGVENKRLNEQVKRNLARFPEDFMFQLTKEEYLGLRSQFATLNQSSNIRIMRAFTAIPQIVNQSIQVIERIVNIEQHQQETDGKIEFILDRIMSVARPKTIRTSERITVQN